MSASSLPAARTARRPTVKLIQWMALLVRLANILWLVVTGGGLLYAMRWHDLTLHPIHLMFIGAGSGLLELVRWWILRPLRQSSLPARPSLRQPVPAIGPANPSGHINSNGRRSPGDDWWDELHHSPTRAWYGGNIHHGTLIDPTRHRPGSKR